MPAFDRRTWDAWYVNLDSRPDRARQVRDELARVGIKARRQRGMLPAEYKGDPAKIQTMLNSKKPGNIGCHFTEMRLIERCLQTKRNMMILEDDVLFCDDLSERITHVEHFLKDREWDIMWLNGTVHINPPVWHKDTLGRDVECTDDPRMVRSYGAFCTQCYVVNADSAEKILRLMDENVARSTAVDWCFIQVQPFLQTFMFLPGCTRQRDGFSDIGNAKSNHSNFAKKLGPYWFARRMEDFDPATFDFGEARR